MLFKETSAKEATNVSEMVRDLVQMVFLRGIKCPSKMFKLEEQEKKKS